MDIKTASLTEFKTIQLQLSNANFLQSSQISEVQEKRGNFFKTERLIFSENNKVIGFAVVNYRKRKKFFTDAIITQGPVLDYSNPVELKTMIQQLEKHVKKNKALSLLIHPYVQTNDKTEQLIKEFGQLGYDHEFDSDNMLNGINQAFIKDLSEINDQKELFDSYSKNVQRDISKFKSMGVKVRRLQLNELNDFYDILYSTSKRKHFFVQDLDFFQKIYSSFNNDALFMYAYLDCKTYINYLDEHINQYSQKIDDLKAKPQTKRSKGKIKDLTSQMDSFILRKEKFEAFDIKTDQLPLSSYLFVAYGDEITSYVGGNIEEYMNFGGATLINDEILKYAISQNIKYFNFGGTIETESASSGTGNYKYKKQFGGELVQYIGSFTKDLSLIAKLFH
ncbi:peptidoglycan bridge formation glycyltransferase FemA/FemB family protein [Streptococcus ictaluri]|uniref:FemAB family protein n=1 Tax=Streptococcus ictaluri 707-05 TaxID=764299 RepID=G5K289_9STRE|nr:peptidoglycan bridge formation glycyltransferase FemA/FemB family protein [Streptococcus ictaluri]EHI70244.1 FemAB family protein [Streptococcus ictaluri 707-05]